MSWADLFKEGVKKRDIIAAIQSLTAAPPNHLCGYYVEENNNMKKMMTMAEFKALAKSVDERWQPPSEDEWHMPVRPIFQSDEDGWIPSRPPAQKEPAVGKMGEWVTYDKHEEQPKAEIAKDEFEPHVLKDWERLSGILND